MLSLVLVALLAPAFACSADTSAPNDWSVRNALDDALENIRTIIFNGDPGRGIPVLDPLTVDEWGFAVNEQPMLTAQGSVSQVTFEGLGAFEWEQPPPPIGIVPPRIIVVVRVRVPALRAAGSYRLAGEVHTPLLNDSAIDAAGDFTMFVKDISVLVKVQITLNFKVKNVYVTLGLGDVFIDVQGAGKVGNIINDEAALRVQTWFAENRSQMELQLADTIKKGMQSHLGKESRTWSILG